jgi:uncharacterized Zn finger protein (UPF0148 family)
MRPVTVGWYEIVCPVCEYPHTTERFPTRCPQCDHHTDVSDAVKYHVNPELLAALQVAPPREADRLLSEMRDAIMTRLTVR